METLHKNKGKEVSEALVVLPLNVSQCSPRKWVHQLLSKVYIIFIVSWALKTLCIRTTHIGLCPCFATGQPSGITWVNYLSNNDKELTQPCEYTVCVPVAVMHATLNHLSTQIITVHAKLTIPLSELKMACSDRRKIVHPQMYARNIWSREIRQLLMCPQ